MLFARAVLSFVIPVAFAAFSPELGASVRERTEIVRRVYFTPATPLDQIPLYAMESSSPDAVRFLDAELARLYTHATTLPSGPDRRAFQTRIYLLEKRMHPLQTQFDARSWTDLRAAVRLEWETVQASLQLAIPSPAPSPITASGQPVASVD